MADKSMPGRLSETEALLSSQARSDEESTLAEETAEFSAQTGLVPQLTFFNGFALLVSFQIGSGLFSSPAQVNNNVPSPGVAVLVWGCAGILAWTGASCMAELGAAIPLNGAMQEYLHYIYGDFMSFLVSIIWILAVKPASMAILSIIFAEYWTGAIFNNSHDTYWLNKSLAITTLMAMTLFNSISTNTTSRLNNIFIFIKLSTVGIIVLLSVLVMFTGLNAQGDGPSQDWKQKGWFTPRPTEKNGVIVDWTSLTTWESLGYYSAALWGGLWAYGGWDNVSCLYKLMIFFFFSKSNHFSSG
jgi:solute carrier family 7 (L-type amino acid transporter), member 9/15